MLPSRRDKVELSNLGPAERQAFAKYGKLPHKGLNHIMRGNQRKYFDSGDYALSKAGRAPQSVVGTAIPNPENIPHASNLGNGHSNGHQMISISPTNSTSPVNKESGLANDENTNVPEEHSKVEKRLPGSGEESEIVGEETNIPHTLSLGNARSNLHQTNLTSLTSPLNKWSGLSKENTIVLEEQLPESGEGPVIVDEKSNIPLTLSHQTIFTSRTSPLNKGSGLANENTIVLEEQLSESGEEPVIETETT